MDIENTNKIIELGLNELIQKQSQIKSFIELAVELNNPNNNSKLENLQIIPEISF